MSSSVEERLRQALRQQAGTTTSSPDGWRRVREMIDTRGQPRRQWFVPWVLAPAAAVVLILLLAAVVQGGGERTLHVTGDSGRLYLAPTGMEPRFQLAQASEGPPQDRLSPWTFRAFGRRAADRVAVEASVVITMPGDRAVNGTTPDAVPLRALGRDVPVARDPSGQTTVSWTQPDGRTVGVITFGLSEAQLVAMVESLLPADAATAVPALPVGFTPISSGTEDGVPPRVTLQSWHAGDGSRFSVAVSDDARATVEDLAWWLPGSQARKLRNTTALYRGGDESLLVWIERPGTVVTLQGNGVSEQELVAIAQGLRPISDAAWRDLTNRAPAPPPSIAMSRPDIGPPPGAVVPANVYFVLVPVRGRTDPPCPTNRVGVFLPETVAGREVGCYEVSGPFVYADDVDTAVARLDPTSGAWAVDYTLTPQGVDHMNALYRAVGAGGQFGVVVDGRLVSAPRFDGPPGTKGAVTGLDEQTARGLAGRLSR